MSEKKAKEQRRVDLTAEVKFNRKPNGDVTVSGDIHNPIAIYDIIGKGCLALVQFYSEQAQKAQSRIITPNHGVILPK